MSEKWNRKIDPIPFELNDMPALRQAWMLMVKEVHDLRTLLGGITNEDGTLKIDNTTIPPGSLATSETVTDVDFTGGLLKETKKTLTVIAVGPPADNDIVTFVEGCPP